MALDNEDKQWIAEQVSERLESSGGGKLSGEFRHLSRIFREMLRITCFGPEAPPHFDQPRHVGRQRGTDHSLPRLGVLSIALQLHDDQRSPH